MDIEEKSFINILSSYLNGTMFIPSENIQWNKIYELSKLHNLTFAVYMALKNSNVQTNSEILEKFRINFLLGIKYAVIQEATAKNLIDIFNANNISHIIFKGLVIREFYIHKESRSMGDIDIIIKHVDREKTHKLLLNNGFMFDEAASHKEVFNYSKNGVCFEIHTSIISSNIADKYDLITYFADNFKYAINIENNTYEFTPEHHFIYLMAHMAKHFKFSGCGVRLLLDIPFFVKHYRNLNWNYIKTELDSLGLLDFTKIILQICEKWFKMPVPKKLKQDTANRDTEEIENYIISGGVFGYHNRNIDSIRIGAENNSYYLRLKNMLKLVFPSYEKLTERYVWANKMPKWSLPVAWIRLWWYRVFVNKENSMSRVLNALKAGDDAKEHNRLMKIVKLK